MQCDEMDSQVTTNNIVFLLKSKCAVMLHPLVPVGDRTANVGQDDTPRAPHSSMLGSFTTGCVTLYRMTAFRMASL